MATVKAFFRTSTRKAAAVNVRFRLSAGRGVQLFHSSEIEVPPAVWDDAKQEIKAKVFSTRPSGSRSTGTFQTERTSSWRYTIRLRTKRTLRPVGWTNRLTGGCILKSMRMHRQAILFRHLC